MTASVHTPVCDLVGSRYPIFAFSHHREVVAAVSRVGGIGVYGAAYYAPEQADDDMAWISRHVDGKPYGVDVMIPSTSEQSTEADLERMQADLEQRIPADHRRFVADLYQRFALPPVPTGQTPVPVYPLGPSAAAARQHIASAFDRGARLVVSALGTPPADAVGEAHRRGLVVGAMVGNTRHVTRQREAGVDLIIAQGSEAAAHAGDISTMVLVPQVVAAAGTIPVLAAGGIATGQQFAAARALGAQGIWSGSLWRTATENPERSAVVRQLLDAQSTDTVRSRCMTGKPLRQLRNRWNEAWDAPDAPDALPMPLQRMLTAEAEQRIDHYRRDELVVSPIGEVVGQLTVSKPAADLVAELVSGYLAAVDRLA